MIIRLKFIFYYAIIPLLLGSLIYLLNSKSLIFHSWLEYFGKQELLSWLQSWHSDLPKEARWLRFYAGDALWSFGFVSYVSGILYSKTQSIWLWWVLAISLSSSYELGQALKIFPGTFDPWDLMISMISGGIAFWAAKKHLSEKLK